MYIVEKLTKKPFERVYICWTKSERNPRYLLFLSGGIDYRIKISKIKFGKITFPNFVHPISHCGEPLKVKKLKIRVTRKLDPIEPKKYITFHQTLPDPHLVTAQMLFGCWIGLQDLFCISLAPDSFGLTLAVLNSKSASTNPRPFNFL